MIEDDLLAEIELILKILSYQLATVEDIDADHIDSIMKLLSNQKRRKMLFELARGEEFVNELVEKLNYHPQSIIRHLSVLKENQLIAGREQSTSGRGRPRLYYKLDPRLAEVISQIGVDKPKEPTNVCNVFPRLRLFLNRLNEPISHTELSEIISTVEKMKEEHTLAIELCEEILKKAKAKIYDVKIVED